MKMKIPPCTECNKDATKLHLNSCKVEIESSNQRQIFFFFFFNL